MTRVRARPEAGHALRRAAAIFVAAAALAAPAHVLAEPDAGEYAVKAAFLLHFAKLVTWPDAALAADAPLTIGVFVADPFDGALRAVAAGARAHGRELRVRAVPSVAQARQCQILFVPATHAGRLDELRNGLADAPVLMVGESEGFANDGGAINFYLEGGRIRFEVNRVDAERAGLRLSSRLLRLARLVEPEEGS